MELEYIFDLQGDKYQKWYALLTDAGLTPGTNPEVTALLWDGEKLVATASREGNVLKYIAVASEYQGMDLTARILTALRQDAFNKGIDHLFLYTKPHNEAMFAPLFFYPVVQTEDVLLMENVCDGVEKFLESWNVSRRQGTIGCAVMHCDPFTLGHRYLIETAAKECDWLYVLVLSEEKGRFTAGDRLQLVRNGTADISNVTVLPSGPYLISSATFPNYFLKDRDRQEEAHCKLDIQFFARYYAPYLGVTRRYVGSEPISALTAKYNIILKEHLPQQGIDVREIPRLEQNGIPVSASAVRTYLDAGQKEQVRQLVPKTTMIFLEQHRLI